jgi:hypothetical protein
MIMSELSIAELQAESVELLPERETLSVIINANTTAIAHDAFGALAIGSPITVVDSGNTVGSYDGNTVGSFDGNHFHL